MYNKTFEKRKCNKNQLSDLGRLLNQNERKGYEHCQETVVTHSRCCAVMPGTFPEYIPPKTYKPNNKSWSVLIYYAYLLVAKITIKKITER